jgi:hypothetical protein
MSAYERVRTRTCACVGARVSLRARPCALCTVHVPTSRCAARVASGRACVGLSPIRRPAVVSCQQAPVQSRPRFACRAFKFHTRNRCARMRAGGRAGGRTEPAAEQRARVDGERVVAADDLVPPSVDLARAARMGGRAVPCGVAGAWRGMTARGARDTRAAMPAMVAGTARCADRSRVPAYPMRGDVARNVRTGTRHEQCARACACACEYYTIMY